jgi:type I restriction enzyme, S subunit
MSSEVLFGRFSIGDLIKAGVISAHKDGNFGSLYPRICDFVADGIPLLTAKVVSAGRIDFNAAQKLSQEKAARLPYGFIQAGDVLLSHNATVGRVAVVPKFSGQAMIGTSLTYFRLDSSRLLPRYLACFFESRDFQNQLASVMGLSTRNQVPITAQRLLEVEVPSLAVQRQLSDFVGAIDDRITLLHDTNATLEAIAQALFKSWFVDFDPVRAKMERRAPEGMDEATAALFPDGFEESELGLVPSGWRVGTIGEISQVIDCLHAKKPELLAEGQPFLQLSNIRDDALLDLSKLALISQSDYLKWISRIEVQGGDCVITNVGRVGAVAQIPVGFRAAMGRNMSAIKLRSDWPYPTYMVELLQSSGMRAEIQRRTDVGTILDALNVRNIPVLRCVLPGKQVLAAFETVCRPLRAAMEANLQRENLLANVRDTLLPRLISGQLRLPEAEALLEESCA